MQVSLNEMTVNSTEPAPVQSIKTTTAQTSTDVKSSTGRKVTYRRFIAENSVQIKYEWTLADQFNSGSLQQEISRKQINPHTLIHIAILENNPEVIKFLLSQGVDVDYPDDNGMSPLTIAILNRSTDVIEVLLANKANPNPSIKWCHMSLLELALHQDEKKSIKLLIDAGADTNYPLTGDWKEHSFITVAMIFKKDMELVQQLINAGANINEKESKKSALIVAVQNNLPINIAKILIEKGANVNVKSPIGNDLEHPLFHDVIFGKNIELAKLFINAGVDLNKMDYLRICIENKSPFDFIKFLIEKGANVNGTPQNPGSPLKSAVNANNIELIKLLTEKGANVNIANNGSYTILLDAIRLGNTAVVKLLVEAGGNVNGTPQNPGSPLKSAINANNIELIKLLIGKGADINIANSESTTALLDAIRAGNITVVKLLVEAGADVNKKVVINRKRYSPLKEAVNLTKPEIVQYLLQHGAR